MAQASEKERGSKGWGLAMTLMTERAKSCKFMMPAMIPFPLSTHGMSIPAGTYTNYIGTTENRKNLLNNCRSSWLHLGICQGSWVRCPLRNTHNMVALFGLSWRAVVVLHDPVCHGQEACVKARV